MAGALQGKKGLVVGVANDKSIAWGCARALRDAGWADAFSVAGVKRPYSYVYNGQSGRLDHALLSPALAKRLKGAAEWHSNADEPDGEGYAGKDVTGPWRSSDHDPMLLGFDL